MMCLTCAIKNETQQNSLKKAKEFARQKGWKVPDTYSEITNEMMQAMKAQPRTCNRHKNTWNLSPVRNSPVTTTFVMCSCCKKEKTQNTDNFSVKQIRKSKKRVCKKCVAAAAVASAVTSAVVSETASNTKTNGEENTAV